MERYKNLILKENEEIRGNLLLNFFIEEFNGSQSNIEKIENLFSSIDRVESSIERRDIMVLV